MNSTRHDSGTDCPGDAEKRWLDQQEDLVAYKAVERTPISGDYRGIRFTPCHRHLPAVFISYKSQYSGKLRYAEVRLWQRRRDEIMAEAEKYAYADRSEYLGDRILSKYRGRR